MSFEAYQAAYQAADDAKKTLVDGTAIPECVEKVLVGHNQAIDAKGSFVKALTYGILGVQTKADAISELTKAGIADSVSLYDAALSCVEGKTGQTLQSAPVAPAAIPQPPVTPKGPDLAKEMKEVEAALKTVPKMRTMGQDIANQDSNTQIPVHSSTQETLLQEVKPKSSIPPPA